MSELKYDHQAIEKKWQERWAKEGAFRSTNAADGVYVLDMFPYPSGDGLHVGHPEGYTATDIYTRYLRMNGKNVLHPMGWDAFGLPAENYAIKMGVHPADVTEKNIANFKRQIQSLGFSYDWDREVNTTDPKYYKWTQWIFLQLFKAGLAYEKEAPIWWCPKDKTGLANEEVVNGKCDRCGTTVEKKMLKQWMLKITAYADRLLEGLNDVDWPEGIKALQRNWIGKSEGAEVVFEIPAQGRNDGESESVTVFTTRPDTLFGATYLVLSPEHELVKTITSPEQKKAVEAYCKKVASKSDRERMSEGEKEKTGVFTGAYAINPVNNEKIPVWIADYVLSSYGTGAIMAVPAHDERDFAFAKKFGLEIRSVIKQDQKVTGVGVMVLTTEGEKIVFQERDGKTDRDPNQLSFFGGMIEPDENPINAAIREVQEELGIQLSPNHLSSIGVFESVNTPGEMIEVFQHTLQKSYSVFKPTLLEGVSIVTIPVEKAEASEKVNAFAKKVLRATRDEMQIVYTGEGIMKNSGVYNGQESGEARENIVATLEKSGQAKSTVQFKLRDWVFSRQRYWGEPIPLVDCEKCGVVPLPEDQLPLELPNVEKYEPTGTGESPLAGISEWVNTECPTCGGAAKRETNTMPQWAGSCWYYLRFCDPMNDKEFASAAALKAWLPVDMYVGGAEHAVLHLMYARFWHKVLFDAGFIPKEVGDEPFKKLKNQGLILGPDGEKMSKSRGNVINPDEIVEKYGADTLRMYEMFMGPFEDAKPWDTNGILGVRRFLEKVWRAAERVEDTPADNRWHKYAQNISEGIETFRLNTCVSDFMKWANEWGTGPVSKQELSVFLQLLSPLAPHIAEELWSHLGHTTLLAQEAWPTFDPSKTKDETVTITVQVMGKLRGTLAMPTGVTQAEVEAAAKAEPNVAKYLTSEPKKVIFVKDKLINFVV